MAPQTGNVMVHAIDLASLGIKVGTSRDLDELISQLHLPDVFRNVTSYPFPVQQPGESTSNFQSREKKYLELFIQTIAYQEGLLHSSAEERILRSEIVNNPLVQGLTMQQGSDNTDINLTNRIAPATASSRLRQRTWDSTAIAVGVYISSQFVAHDRDARIYLSKLSGQGVQIPRILTEAMNSNRISIAGSKFITLGYEPLTQSFLQSCA